VALLVLLFALPLLCGLAFIVVLEGGTPSKELLREEEGGRWGGRGDWGGRRKLLLLPLDDIVTDAVVIDAAAG
jgi:hypothetical protein